jgi:hypothetical protein
MEFTSLGGGIMVALAAGLWLVYLLPTWFKRREYAAVERVEERRQQALRVLQETSTVPAVVRAKAIVSPTGQVTDRDKLAEAIKRSKDAQAAREASRTYARATATVPGSTSSRTMSRRIRRTRAFASLFLLTAIVTIGIQVGVMVADGIAMGAWAVLGFATVVGVVAASALGRLSSMSRRHTIAARPAARARRVTMSSPLASQADAAEEPSVTSWTPVPVPKPVYLSRAEVEPVEIRTEEEIAIAHAALVARLHAAARDSDSALRDAQESPEITPIPQREEPAASDSRFARMGIVGLEDVATPDIDEVLRRRRQAS